MHSSIPGRGHAFRNHDVLTRLARLARRTAGAPVVLSLALTACQGDADAPSTLEKRARDRAAPPASDADAKSRADAKAGDTKRAEDTKQTSPDQSDTAFAEDGSVRLLTDPDGDKTQLRLRLEESSVYQVTTIGGVVLPGVNKPTGFARQQELRLRDCAGEGVDRTCTIEHKYTRFDAEPPTGVYLKADEDMVAELVTSYTLRADGRMQGPARVEGPEDKLGTQAAQQLAEVDRLYCIRLPPTPVAPGARWSATCKRRVGGKLESRKVIYMLKTLDEEPGTGEKRAEISFAGSVTAIDSKSERTGLAAGTLYLWASTGEPHLLDEKITLAMADSVTGLKTETTLKVQFARLDPGPPPELTRTDGRPFPRPPRLLNADSKAEIDGPQYRVAPPPQPDKSDADAKKTPSADANAKKAATDAPTAP